MGYGLNERPADLRRIPPAVIGLTADCRDPRAVTFRGAGGVHAPVGTGSSAIITEHLAGTEEKNRPPGLMAPDRLISRTEKKVYS